MKKDKIQMTKEGVRDLEKELEELREKLPLAVKRLARAREQGDLTENSEYNYARDDLEVLEDRIKEMEEILSKAEVVSSKRGRQKKVGVGIKVVVKLDGSKEEYRIVNEYEADPNEGKISDKSPLGVVLMGKKPGDKGEVDLPQGKMKFEILELK